MASYEVESGRDPRREILDRWAIDKARMVHRASETSRRQCFFYYGGKRMSATVDDFHDAMNTAYLELVRGLNHDAELGTEAGAASERAIRGLANLRLVSRLHDGWRRGSSRSAPCDVATIHERRNPGARTAPGDEAIVSQGPLGALVLVLDLKRAATRLNPSDCEVLARSLVGETPQELAHHLHVTPLAARQRLHRARRRFSSELAA